MANKLGRYVWLVSVLRNYGRLTYEEISDRWERSGLNAGEPLSLRTFHNHRKAVADVFEVDIECDVHDGYKYYIENADQLAGDSFRSWLIDSYSVLNQVRIDRSLADKIQFENMPSGGKYLTTVLDAMREKRTLSVSYQGFNKAHAYGFKLEPYHLKIHNRRWYVIGRIPGMNQIRTLCLDRVVDLRMEERHYEIDADFSINDYFEGGVGVMGRDSGDIERVVIKCTGASGDYVETLPIHPSQREIERGEGYVVFELVARTNFELIQQLLLQVDQIEVLEPLSLRQRMKTIGENITKRHSSFASET